jgi:hypothetical protein
MSEQDYQKYLIETIEETYPKYYQNKLLKKLENKGIISFSKDLLTTDEMVDLSTVEEKDYLKTTILNNENAIKVIEESEFTNQYNYSVLYHFDEFPQNVLDQLTDRDEVKDINKESHDHDQLFSEASDEIIPTKFVSENVIILKFSRLLTGYLAISGPNKRTIKYPILAILFKDLNVLELRFGKVKGYLKNNDEFFYRKQIDLVTEWIEQKLQCELTAINLTPVVDFISKQDQDEVNVSAQAMNLATGGKAVLDTGVNDDFVLPLLGELKELIKANEILFNGNKEIKDLIENFILELENTSDLPWISLTWRNEAKTKATKVKFNFNYMNQEYSLLQYYGNKTEMERMNNVTRYLIENKRAFEQQNTGEPDSD